MSGAGGKTLQAAHVEILRTHVVKETEADRQKQAMVYGLGIAGEAGEVADLIKKVVGHGHPLDREKLLLELGDVVFYVAGLAELFGWTLEDVAQSQIDKLWRRFPEGFSREASIARVDVKGER